MSKPINPKQIIDEPSQRAWDKAYIEGKLTPIELKSYKEILTTKSYREKLKQYVKRGGLISGDTYKKDVKAEIEKIKDFMFVKVFTQGWDMHGVIDTLHLQYGYNKQLLIDIADELQKDEGF